MSDVSSPISGRVLALHVKAGEAVQAGEPLFTVESMKMEIPIEAERGGIVAEWLIDATSHNRAPTREDGRPD